MFSLQNTLKTPLSASGILPPVGILLQVHLFPLGSPYVATFNITVLVLSQVFPCATRVLRSDWTTPLLIPVAGEPIPAQLLWLHVQSSSLLSKPESHGVQKHRGHGAFWEARLRVERWFSDFKRKIQETQVMVRNRGPGASAREINVTF